MTATDGSDPDILALALALAKLRRDCGDDPEAYKAAAGRLLARLRGGAAPVQKHAEAAAPDAARDARAFADFARGTLELLRRSGMEEQAEALAESLQPALDACGWAVALGEDGRYRMRPSEPDAAVDAFAERAPKGGVSIGGKQYRGGQFVPGAVIKETEAKAASGDPQAKQDLANLQARKKADEAAAAAKTQARAGRGNIDPKALASRLSQHQQAASSAAKWERDQVAASARMLHRHHGALALHRLDEIAGALEKALEATDDPDMRERLSRRLGLLAGAVGLLTDEKRKVTGAVPEGMKPPAEAKPQAAMEPDPAEIGRRVEADGFVGSARRKLDRLKQAAATAEAEAVEQERGYAAAQPHLRSNWKPKQSRSLAESAKKAVAEQEAYLAETVARKQRQYRAEVRGEMQQAAPKPPAPAPETQAGASPQSRDRVIPEAARSGPPSPPGPPPRPGLEWDDASKRWVSDGSGEASPAPAAAAAPAASPITPGVRSFLRGDTLVRVLGESEKSAAQAHIAAMDPAHAKGLAIVAGLGNLEPEAARAALLGRLGGVAPAAAPEPKAAPKAADPAAAGRIVSFYKALGDREAVRSGRIKQQDVAEALAPLDAMGKDGLAEIVRGLGLPEALMKRSMASVRGTVRETVTRLYDAIKRADQ